MLVSDIYNFLSSVKFMNSIDFVTNVHFNLFVYLFEQALTKQMARVQSNHQNTAFYSIVSPFSHCRHKLNFCYKIFSGTSSSSKTYHTDHFPFASLQRKLIELICFVLSITIEDIHFSRFPCLNMWKIFNFGILIVYCFARIMCFFTD